MNFNNFTIKAQEAIQKASEIAQGNQQQAIDTAHLLKGLLTVDENVVSYVLKKLNVNLNTVDQQLTAAIQKLPKVTGGDVYLSSTANSALQKANSFLKEFKDDFVSVEHLLLGLLAVNDTTAKLLKEQGVNEKDLKKAITELRGDNRVTDQNAEATYQALSKYARNLNEYAESGKLDPVIGRDMLSRNEDLIYYMETWVEPQLVFKKNDKLTAHAQISQIMGNGILYSVLIKKSLNYHPESIDNLDLKKVIIISKVEHKDLGPASKITTLQKINDVYGGESIVLGTNKDNEGNAITAEKAWESGQYNWVVLYKNTSYNMSVYKSMPITINF